MSIRQTGSDIVHHYGVQQIFPYVGALEKKNPPKSEEKSLMRDRLNTKK
jgi:hypothetical protein